MRSQYLRCPVGAKDNLYVISHQSLFMIKDNNLFRLCDFKSEVRDLKISPDGSLLSFFSREESNGDIYCYRIGQASISRITYFDDPRLINAMLSNDTVFVSSAARSRTRVLYKVDIDTKNAQKLPYSDANSLTSSQHKTVVQRFGYGYHMWRKYQGGMAARLYLFEPDKAPIELVLPDNNAYMPIFVGSRLFFISDIDSSPNIYEYSFADKKCVQKTFHTDFCVRDISVMDDDKILYACGGKIYKFDLKTAQSDSITINGIDYSYTDSPYTITNPIDYLTSCAINDKGEVLSLAMRGQVMNYNVAEKSFRQSTSSIRYRHTLFLSNTLLLQVKDNGDSSIFEVYNLDESELKSSMEFAVGQVRKIRLIDKDKIVIQNHKAVLFIVNLDSDELIQVIRGKFNKISGFDISVDQKWIAYSSIGDASMKSGETTSAIFLYNIQSAMTYRITKGGEWSPSFSKDGKYLYYLSGRDVKPKYDSFYFNLYFPSNDQICALCLNKDVEHPFKPWTFESNKSEKVDKAEKSESIPEIMVDEIIAVKSDLPPGNYSYIYSISESKILIISQDENTTLQVADLTNNSLTVLGSNIDLFSLSHNREWMTIASNDKLRLGKAGEQFDDNDKSYKDGGWISLNGFTVEPKDEWKNILFETWWLIKERFWHKDMNNLDWNSVLHKYESVVDSLRSREDLNLLLEELMGENGTSHNYIYDRGDNSASVHPKLGYLAAKFTWHDGYKIEEIENVSEFDGFRITPLMEPGVSIKIGDVIVEIDGIKCQSNLPIEHYFQFKANKKVTLTYMRDNKKHNTVVQPLASVGKLKYRKWVDANREYVHKKTNGRVGYIHIPDMGPEGFVEFHKAYNQERNYDGIMIDVRNNGGGHVSSLIIKTLLNIQTGFDVSQDQFHPYPEYSNKGKFVLLSNEYCGSDGDVFTYMFRKYGMGEIVGRRTWGGVVGIETSGSYRFIDRGYTTQPGFALVQYDVGLSIENRGVEPDFDIKTPPLVISDWPENDPQLKTI